MMLTSVQCLLHCSKYWTNFDIAIHISTQLRIKYKCLARIQYKPCKKKTFPLLPLRFDSVNMYRFSIKSGNRSEST